MPEVTPQPSQSVQPQAPQGKGISWKKIVVSVVAIAVVAGIIAGGLYWFFVINEEETTTEPTKISTPSAKKATPSAKKEKDETADWKVLTAKTPESNPDIYDPTKTIKFSFRYPPDFRIVVDHGNSVVTNDDNYQLGVKTPGSIGVIATVGESGEKPSPSTETTLGGNKAFRGIKVHDSLRSVEYFLPSVTTEEGEDMQFSFRCNYIPKDGVSAEKICDLIASTFKFLD
jgi:hypothetical protein